MGSVTMPDYRGAGAFEAVDMPFLVTTMHTNPDLLLEGL